MTIYQTNTTPIRVQPSANKRVYLVVARFLVIILALLIWTGLYIDLITNNWGLVAYTLLLLVYIIAEIKNLWEHQKRFIFLNPVILASIFSFIIPYGISNILYLFSHDALYLLGIPFIVTPWMNQVMLLAILSAFFMWLGYSSVVARNMGRKLQRNRLLNKWIITTYNINHKALYTFVVISFLAKLLIINSGGYGYSSDAEVLISTRNYSQYFGLADSLGKLCLLVVAMQCFSTPRATRGSQSLLIFLLGFQIAFGFLSGFKSAVVLPLIVVGMIYYSQRNRFPLWLLPFIIVSMYAAYMVIEPYRNGFQKGNDLENTSISSITSAMNYSFSSGSDEDNNSTLLKFLSRNHMTSVSSLGIEYVANHELNPNDPHFLENIILSPIHAIVPRFLWKNKPLEDTGLWYTNVVMGLDLYSSTGFGAITYFNFVGGIFAVCLGFLIVGIIQRVIYDGFFYFGSGGLIIYFGLLLPLIQISALNIIVIDIIRFVPILIITQLMIFKR